MRIAVYLGSSYGRGRLYRKIAADLGCWIGENGHTLVYGGAAWGLMGELADNVLGAGGEVIGIVPSFLEEGGGRHPGLTRLEIVSTMSQRKQRMIDLSEAAVALPGGPGTLEEITEIISLSRLGDKRPCILFDADDFWKPLKDMLAKMIEEEFVKSEEITRVHFVTSLEECVALLK